MKKLFSVIILLNIGLSVFAQSPYIHCVDEYVPAPGQFVNTMPQATEDDTPETMARKCTEAIGGNKGGLVSLGGFGGYITFRFDHPVVNVEGEYDLRFYGNAHSGSAECGIVMVSQDTNHNGLPDDEWYELAGSADIDSLGKVDYGYAITYQPAPLQAIPWTDNRENSGTINRVAAHQQEYYPLWIKESLSFSGTRLPDNATDISGVGAYYVLESLRYGYVDNLPNMDAEGNSFNLDWAVDKNRQPVKLSHVDFIRVYCAMNQQCGWLGETSTEVSGAEDLHLQASLDFAASLSPAETDLVSVQQTAYNLNGQRINLSGYKGIGIKNRKKILYKTRITMN